MADLLLYSPKDVTILLGGIHALTGYSQGTFVTIRKHTPPFEIIRSADGHIARSYRNDQSYTIEVALAQSSPSNNVLSMLQAVDLTTQKGLFPLFIKDGEGSTTFVSTSTWVSDVPEVRFSDGIESRVWVFHSTQGILSVGGSGDKDLISEVLQGAIDGAPLLDKLGVV